MTTFNRTICRQDIPWSPKGYEAGDGPRHTGLVTPLPDDHPLRIACTDDYDRIIDAKCQVVAKTDEFAKSFLALFGVSAFGKGQAKSLYRQVLNGKMTPGFLAFLRDHVRPDCPWQFADVSQFFKTYRGFQHDQYLTRLAKRRDRLAREYVEATVDRATDEEIQKEYLRSNSNSRDYLPAACTDGKLADFVRNYPDRFGTLVLSTRATWEEVLQIEAENNYTQRVYEWQWREAHPGEYFDPRKDTTLKTLLREVDFKWRAIITCDADYHRLREVVLKFVIGRAWVLQRFDPVARFWGLDIDELRAAAEINARNIADELEELGWDPSLYPGVVTGEGAV